VTRPIALLALLLALAAPPLAVATPVSAAADYLEAAQGGDGCVAHDPSVTAWAAIGLRAAGRLAAASAAAGCVATTAATRTTATDRELAILAAVAGGRDPRAFGGRDLVADLLRSRKGAYFTPGGTTNGAIFGVLALRAARARVPASVLRGLLRDQAPGGTWDYYPEGGSADMTAAAIQALHAAGYSCTTTPLRRALTALRRFRAGDGYAIAVGSRANSQSTAFVLQGLRACGRRDRRALRWLRAQQEADGSVRFGPSNVPRWWVTAQALPALAGRTLPVR
jgi:hypothetical protein